jgi:hypothetical protein
VLRYRPPDLSHYDLLVTSGLHRISDLLEGNKYPQREHDPAVN